jgi:CRISPR/Cas system-associated endonuclease/helicase Cas3
MQSGDSSPATKRSQSITIRVVPVDGDNKQSPITFTCANTSETFDELLSRFKKEHSKYKEYEALYSGNVFFSLAMLTRTADKSVPFPPNQTVLSVLKDNEEVILYKKETDPIIPNLRMYQKELIAKALRENAIIVSPTGSGKTLIAVAVFLELARKPHYKERNLKGEIIDFN